MIYLDDAERGIAAANNASKLAEAIANANKWVDVARPIIQAWIIADGAFMPVMKAQMADPTNFKRSSEWSFPMREWRMATKVIDKARDELYDMLAGIRDNYRCDYCMSQPESNSDEEWDTVEAFNEELERSMIGVDAAVRMVEDEAHG